MCGRFILFTSTEALREAVSAYLSEDVGVLPGNWWQPSWNIAPTHRIVVVRRFRGRLVLGPASWGFPAPWKPGMVLFNARGETVFEKASFQGAEPALVVMNGWYEWATRGVASGAGPASDQASDLGIELGTGKTPYLVRSGSDGSAPGLMVVAGLVKSETPIQGEVPELRATIITSASAEPVKWLHDRMPRVLSNVEAAHWLQNESDSLLRDAAATIPAAEMRATLHVQEVDKRVGTVSINGPELISGI